MIDPNELVSAQFSANRETVDAAAAQMTAAIAETGQLLAERLQHGAMVLAFGNGGSAAQADHLVAELIGRYRNTRKPLPAISLPASPGSITCIANDFSFDELFERQIEALCRPDDVVVGLTTSGASRNVLRGLQAGKKKGASTIMLTGSGIHDAPADHILAVPSASTARIQEIHLVIIHAWCEIVDEAVRM